MNVPDPDPREGLDPDSPGGLIEGGPADIPGVQDRGPADAEAARVDDDPPSGSAAD